ncbi:MAG: hypothetical protein KIT33_00205 [Candidatus Kapabacteria bacterium]|nr:hypothetical protein [Ignavibacteriota bacterium]MCW5883370.1 hypothetical protein [Candidatus Kapabacteria bacterium]
MTNIEKSKNIAAIDIGSNSIHTIIASVTASGSLNILYHEKQSVRLGKGMDSGILLDDTISAAVEVLNQFVQTAKRYDAKLKAVATSAVREAKNRQFFLDLIEQKCGLKIDVISGEEEGKLIYLGVSGSLDINDKKVLIIDIGGGSTELILADGGVFKLVKSLKLGAIRTSNEFFDNFVTSEESIEKCKEHIKVVMSESIEFIKKYGYDIVVGTSGTIQALGRIALSISGEKPQNMLNNISISEKQLNNIFNIIENNHKPESRAEISGIDTSRADIITAGALILRNLIDELRFPEIFLSSYAMREGIIIQTSIDNINNN